MLLRPPSRPPTPLWGPRRRPVLRWRRGVFKKVSSPSVPQLLISGLRGVESYLLDFEDPPQLDDAFDALLKLFLEGICRCDTAARLRSSFPAPA